MKIRKTQIIIILFFLFNYYSTIAQDKNGKVVYKVVRNIDKKDFAEKLFIKTSKEYETITDEFEFNLIFNNKKSVFFIKEKLYSNEYAAELAKSRINYFGRVKQTKDYSITENLEEDFGQFLVKRRYPKWELLKETKKIGEFLCYKAIFTKVTSYKDKVFKKEYIAWYTPKIPVPYGPSEFGGLPGLIIELQGKGFTYGATKIELNKDIKIPELKKLKLITEEELEEKAKEDEKGWREKG